MSKTLRVSNPRRVYDSDDSDSDFNPIYDDDNDNPQQKQGEEEEEEVDEDCPWKSAVDPASGKTYYYHVKTLETQWQKPIEMASKEEREAIAAKERRQKEFFAAMEANILNSISQGQKAPEKKNRLDLEFENKAISDDPLNVKTPPVTSSSAGTGRLSPTGSLSRSGSSRLGMERNMSKRSVGGVSRPGMVRTISSMDTSVLRELIKRVPSSRQVSNHSNHSNHRGGLSMSNHSNRQYSNRSIGLGQLGSSHHSRNSRQQQLQQRGGAGSFRNTAGPLAAAMAKSSASGGGGSAEDFADDDLPPLTVVTTPDLRKRETVEREVAAQNPRDMLIRGDSLTLDQLTNMSSLHSKGGGGGRAGGGLGNTNFMGDTSEASRLTMSNNSLSFDPNDSASGGFLSHSQTRLNQAGLIYGGGNSFNSLNSSDSHSLGGGMDNSNISVHSNPLMPVEEGADESDYSYPQLKTQRGNSTSLLGGYNDNEGSFEGEGSFSLLDGGGEAESTANWLDALPPDENATTGEDVVGYGDNAKKFSDAGFTSFFDESMANFDLSDKETKALKKLAANAEQMATFAEGDESDESEESESSDSSDDLPELNAASSAEFPLFLEGEDSEDEDMSLESESAGNHSPSFHNTPITSSTIKTTGTSSTTASAQTTRSPTARAPRPGLGNKTSFIPRAVRNKQIREASLDDSDSTHSHNSSADGSIGVSNLALASATLTIDNARSHFTENKPSAGPKQPSRRMSAGAALSDANADLNNSSSSLHSTTSKGMANAARRLSMFRLKNMDRSKLRVVGDGGRSPDSSDGASIGKSVQTDAGGTLTRSQTAEPNGVTKRPDLIRRNTCGTLYVGTTMSSPDRDATIKCVSGVYRAHILQAEMDEITDPSAFQLFNDLEAQQGTIRGNSRNNFQRRPAPLTIPTLEQITTFYRDVFQRAKMEYDCIIISLIYVERLIKTTNGALRPRACNWRSILFSCMVLASKVWDDMSMWNADFSATCPNGVKFPLKRINELEVAILSALSYKVKVPASEYAKYYFLLRSMLIKSGLVGDNVDTATPLDVEGAKRLQQVSTQFQSGMGATRRQMKKAKSMRSKSMGESERAQMNAGARRARDQHKKMNLEQVVQM